MTNSYADDGLNSPSRLITNKSNNFYSTASNPTFHYGSIREMQEATGMIEKGAELAMQQPVFLPANTFLKIGCSSCTPEVISENERELMKFRGTFQDKPGQDPAKYDFVGNSVNL